MSLVPEYHRRQANSEQLYLTTDLDAWIEVVDSAVISPDDYANLTLFDRGALRELRLGSNTQVEFIPTVERTHPYLIPLLRRLTGIARSSGGRSPEPQVQVEIPFHCALSPTAHLTTTSPEVLKYAQQALSRIAEAERIGASDFARTANYTGSKRALSSFLTESIANVLPTNGVVLDLMCGSGAATAAFNRQWRTYASDAQAFSRILAAVQGGGFSEQRAGNLLEYIVPLVRSHAEQLTDLLGSFLDQEDDVLFRDANEEALLSFQRLGHSYPTYPSPKTAGDWKPTLEVELRRADPTLVPYCLFTAYFGNVYFGIRQCVEIDSIRYAIDQLGSDTDRIWALGALVTTLSAVGTTHAAHFAQPRVRPGVRISETQLSKVQDQRSRSVLHEFSIRLLTLAKQSEETERTIGLLPGPWQNALTSMQRVSESGPLLVYLDAPYQRDEYSRYYHVLETLVNYSYPTSRGTGRTPDKGSGPLHRFASEFSTRTESRIAQGLIAIIHAVLRNGWTCAWSYADNGLADIVAVVEAVSARIPCNLQSFATPYIHNSQGRGHSAKRVVEYLTIFSPK